MHTSQTLSALTPCYIYFHCSLGGFSRFCYPKGLSSKCFFSFYSLFPCFPLSSFLKFHFVVCFFVINPFLEKRHSFFGGGGAYSVFLVPFALWILLVCLKQTFLTSPFLRPKLLSFLIAFSVVFVFCFHGIFSAFLLLGWLCVWLVLLLLLFCFRFVSCFVFRL